MNIVKQTELASLSLSQCLTPWLYFTCNPEIFETQTPVNHPPQVFTISKPKLYRSFQQLALICFLQLDTLHSFIVRCKMTLLRRLVMDDVVACCGRWNWADGVSPPLCWWELVVLGLHTYLSLTFGCDWPRLHLLCLSCYSPQPSHMWHVVFKPWVSFQHRVDYECWTYLKMRRTFCWTWNIYLFTHKQVKANIVIHIEFGLKLRWQQVTQKFLFKIKCLL